MTFGGAAAGGQVMTLYPLDHDRTVSFLDKIFSWACCYQRQFVQCADAE